jgi:hypothetical protein
VFRGALNAGVSCESCHGAASGWIESHQQKGARAQAVAAGMRDLRGSVPGIAALCVSCHVTKDARLVAAGHPSGAGFDAGERLARIEHWTTRYDAAALSAAARALAPRLAAAPAVAGAPPTPLAQAGSLPSAPADAGWQDVRPLPSDYGAPEAPPAAAPVSAPEAGLLEPAATTSIAEDVMSLPAPAPPGARIAPQDPAGELLRLRGQALLLAARLLRDGRAAGPPPAAAAEPAEFTGPESELLRLQEETFALLWRALAKPKP